MKLNTKKIFEASSSKVTPKIKTKKSKTIKMSMPYLKGNKISKNDLNINSSIKQKLFQTSNKKINPFSLTSDKNKDLKNSKTSKISTAKKVKINLNKDIDVIDKNNDLFEDSFEINESDTNNNKNILQNKDNKTNKDNIDKLNKKNQNNKNGLDIKDICQFFKNLL